MSSSSLLGCKQGAAAPLQRLAPAPASRRDFFKRAAGYAGGGLVLGAPLVLTSRKAAAQSGFPSFNAAAINPSTMDTLRSVSLQIINDMYLIGRTASGNLSMAQAVYADLANQLQTSGFNDASVQYLFAGAPPPNLDGLFGVLQANGMVMDHDLYVSKMSNMYSLVPSVAIPTVDAYGMPETHYGMGSAAGYFANIYGSSTSAATQAAFQPKALKSPTGSIAPGKNLWRTSAAMHSGGRLRTACSPDPASMDPCGDGGSNVPPPGADSSVCWYVNAAIAYMGIMAIPLSLDGAAFPPLGIGLGIFAAFMGVFAWGFC